MISITVLLTGAVGIGLLLGELFCWVLSLMGRLIKYIDRRQK